MTINNEILFFVFLFLGLGCALFAAKMGKAWLQIFILSSYVGINFVTAKVGSVFGVMFVPGALLFGSIFLATDILTERYGKKAGYDSVWLSLFGALLVQAIVQLARLMEPQPYAQEVSDAMEIVFNSSVRIALVGVAVYVISQRFDVWFYHFIHEKTGDKHLWLRNNVSTITSQFLDSMLFSFFAFFGVMDNWLELGLTVYAFKVVNAVLDTPFMYLARRLTPLDLKPETSPQES